VSLDLPVALRDALRLKDDSDSGRFGHEAEYGPFARSGNE
jgi:hypothetical protein